MKEELEKRGIYGLDRTPGKLITAKGHIDGYLSVYGIVWGKLKMTPEQAEKAMGFKPKKGAVGVLLSRRKYEDAKGKIRSGIFAISLMPWKAETTEKGKMGRERMRVLGKIASEHMSDIIYPIWEPLVTTNSKYEARNSKQIQNPKTQTTGTANTGQESSHYGKKQWDGYRYFMSVNNREVGNALKWGKMRIAEGYLSPPKHICANRLVKKDIGQIRHKGQIRQTTSGQVGQQIEIYAPRTIWRKPITINPMGIGLFDSITGSFFHISPELLTAELKKRLKECGVSEWGLEKTKINSIIEPLKFTWELKYTVSSADNTIKVPTYFKDIVSGKEKSSELKVQSSEFKDEKQYYELGSFRRFYIYNYYKKISQVRGPDLPYAEKTEYSRSICRKVPERDEKIDGKHSVPIVVEIVERA